MNREPEEKQEHESGGLQHAAEHERPHKRLSVMNYLTILFAAAFLLDQAHAAEAMDWFWRIQRELSRGRYGSARSLVEAFQATGLEDCLPTDHPADPEGPSPAEQYQEILAVLY